jgi:hypothetical protein
MVFGLVLFALVGFGLACRDETKGVGFSVTVDHDEDPAEPIHPNSREALLLVCPILDSQCLGIPEHSHRIRKLDRALAEVSALLFWVPFKSHD